MLTVDVIEVGNLRDGRLVSGYRIACASMTVEVWEYGAHLVGVGLNLGGETVNVAPKRGDLTAYDQANRGGYMGATIGRYSNRIESGRFLVDGVEHCVPINDGPHALHGGPIGFDQHIWTSEIVEDRDQSGVRFSTVSPDGDQGFPGRLEVTATYWLSDSGSLTFAYEATSDAPTVVGLTNHTYWNLAGGGTIADHQLQVAADEYVATDESLLPTEIRPVADSRYDFRMPRSLLHDGPGYDDCLVLNGSRPSATLTDPRSGRSMTIETDQPGLQVYTANDLPNPHCGVALEAQSLPNSPNRLDFPSAVLRPGETYRQTTTHTFEF